MSKSNFYINIQAPDSKHPPAPTERPPPPPKPNIRPKPEIRLKPTQEEVDPVADSPSPSGSDIRRRPQITRARNSALKRSGLIQADVLHEAEAEIDEIEERVYAIPGDFLKPPGPGKKPHREESTRSTSSSSGHSTLSSNRSLPMDYANSGKSSKRGSESSFSTINDPEMDDVYEDISFSGWASDEFSSDEEIYSNQDALGLENLENRRARVAKEIMTTEAAYVNRLFTILKTSLMMEGASRVKNMLPDNFRSHMFPSIETIYRLHSENILPSFRSKIGTWCLTSNLSDVWEKYLPYLSVYKLYATQFISANELIQKYRETSSDFSNLLKDLEKGDDFHKLTLENLLLEPIQRLPRYKLLLQSYVKYLYSPDHDGEKGRIEDIISRLNDIIKSCEATMKQEGAYGAFKDIQDRLEDILSIINPCSKLLKEGPCVEVNASTHHKEREKYMFLFSDFLLICSKKKFSDKYIINNHLELGNIRIRPAVHLYGCGYSPDTTMLLKSREQVISLSFVDDKTKYDWEEMLVFGICNSLKAELSKLEKVEPIIEHGNNADFEIAPVWIPDEAKDKCMMCDKQFQLIIRPRHHCRGCGIVACGKCCSHKMVLPYKNKDLGRVCNNCFLRARRDCPDLTRRISTKRPTKKQVRQRREGANSDYDSDGADEQLLKPESALRSSTNLSSSNLSLKDVEDESATC